ncbi:hypothetical protein DFQ29_002628 [Apophysomyces sp. BC1021]|nr:hypothetical protein DFQ29_002628 [Apophysomyces sp. BC1021]
MYYQDHVNNPKDNVDVIFRRPKREADDIQLTVEDFDVQELEESKLWGIDPGISNMFVAVDGCGAERHEDRSFSQNELYTLVDYRKTQSKIQEWRKAEGIEHVEPNFTTAKTSSPV